MKLFKTKGLISLLLVLVMVLGLAAPAFAATPPTATQKKVIDAFWQYTGETHGMLTGLLEKYFLISDPANKAEFLVVYQEVLTALGGYGEKIEAFGLTAQILEKLNTKMSTGRPNTYQAFIGKDYPNFEAGILANWDTLVADYTEDKLIKLADGLNKVFPVAKKYMVLKDDPMVKPSLKMLGYTAGTNSITSLIEYNIRAVIGKGNLLFNMSASYATVQPALVRMQNFYNGLSAADKALVYTTLEEQGFLYKRLVVNALGVSDTSLTGSAEPGQTLRAFAAGQPLTANSIVANGTTGAFSFTGFSPKAANTVITVEAYAENGGNPQVLDTATVTVTPPATPPVTPPVTPPGPPPVTPPVTPPGPPVTPPGPPNNNNNGNNDIELEDPETPLGDLNFTDLLNYDWAREAIAALSKSGVVNGRAANLFMPKENVTRAEFSAMVVRLLKLNLEATNNTFKDVKVTDWFAKEVRTAFVNQLVKGVNSTAFNPKGFVTRQEMGAIIGRVLVVNKFLVTDQNILKQFADLKEIASWAVGDTKLTVQEGIIQGRATTQNNKTVNLFAPKANANRAEAAVMLYRLAGKIPTAVTVASK